MIAAAAVVKMMHASEVATATMSVFSWVWRSISAKYSANAGTITIPPPMPSNPARKPLLIPREKQKAMKNIVSK